QQDGTRFEQRNRRATAGRVRVDNGWNAIVGCDREEVRRELLTLADVDRNDAIREAGLLEKHRDLVTVRRRPVVQIDHEGLLCSAGGAPCRLPASLALPRLRRDRPLEVVPSPPESAQSMLAILFGYLD